MAGTTFRERLAKRAGKRCAVPGCYHYVRNFSRYCTRHDRVNKRTGHPEGKTVSLGQLRPYRDIARRFLDDNLDHPGVTNARDFLVRFLSGVTPPRSIGSRTPPWERLKRWRHRLWVSGVDPLDILAVIVGMFLLQYYDSRAFKSDRHFWHQIVIRVFRLSKPNRDAGAGNTYHQRITVGEREMFTDIMKKTGLMTLGHVVSQEIINREEEQQLARIEGVTAPFHHSHHHNQQINKD